MFLLPVLLMVTPMNAEDAKLANAFQAYLEDEFRRHPVFATQQGRHDYDDRLDDLTPKARAEGVERTKKLLEELPKKFDKAKLSRSAQIDLEIWLHTLKFSLWQELNEDRFRTDPRVWGEYFSDSVFLLFTQSTLPRERNVDNAAKRIAEIPKLIQAAKMSIRNPPKILTEIAIKRTAGAVSFYEKEIYTLAQEPAATSVLRAPCTAAVQSLRDYQAFLEQEVLPRSEGQWRLGKEKFAAKMLLELNSGLSADEVYQAALHEEKRVEAEMYAIAKQLWWKLFPGKPVPADDPLGRRQLIQSVLDQLGQDHGKPETLVQDARQTVEKIRAFIRDKQILTLPDPDRCQIIEMPEFQRGFSAAYLNPAPTFDAQASSIYAIAPPPSDWPESRQRAFFQEYNRAMLQVLTIHEAYPGHYVQLEYANRHPSLIRKVFYSGVFAEGWAVYTEQMMLDQGYGEGDLSLRLHQLKFYMRAVLNAILDHEMHCTNLSDEAGVKMLMERGFQTEGEAVGKIQRAKQSSCQLSTYFTGRMAFYRLRQKVQRSQGDAFRLGPYHESVLSHGSLPVKYLPELVK